MSNMNWYVFVVVSRRVALCMLFLSVSGCDSADIVGAGLGGGVGIRWEPPTQRQDGTDLPLNEIDGYRIYYSDTMGLYTQGNSIYVNGGSVTSATLPGGVQLDQAYYIVMTTIDTDGRESVYSDPVQFVP